LNRPLQSPTRTLKHLLVKHRAFEHNTGVLKKFLVPSINLAFWHIDMPRQ
jgi:hypothetical protein